MQNHNRKPALELNIILILLIFKKRFILHMNRNRIKMLGRFNIYSRSQLEIEMCRLLEIFSPMHLELLAILSFMHLESLVEKGLSLGSFLF